QGEREARVRGREVEDCAVVQIPRARAARHAVEEANEVAPVLPGALLARDRQVGVDALDVLERLFLQGENRWILPGVGDLQNPPPAHDRRARPSGVKRGGVVSRTFRDGAATTR